MFFEPNGMMLVEGVDAHNLIFMVDGSAVAFKNVAKRTAPSKKKVSKRLKGT
jgi:hypothetical protein